MWVSHELFMFLLTQSQTFTLIDCIHAEILSNIVVGVVRWRRHSNFRKSRGMLWIVHFFFCLSIRRYLQSSQFRWWGRKIAVWWVHRDTATATPQWSYQWMIAVRVCDNSSNQQHRRNAHKCQQSIRMYTAPFLAFDFIMLSGLSLNFFSGETMRQKKT